MARVGDEFLDEDTVVAEGGGGLGLGAGETLRHLVGRFGDAHALAAAAGGGLDHHRIADFVGDLHGMLGALDHAEEARHRRDLGRGGGLLRLDLVAHRGDGAGIGADEDDAGLGERLREGLTLGEEAVAGMDRLGAGLLAGVDDLVDQEIGLGGRSRTDMHSLVGHRHVDRVAVGVGIDGHRLDAHFLGRLDDAAGDLAPVGNQDFIEHCSRFLRETVLACPSRRQA